MSVLLNTFKSVVLKPVRRNTVSHTVTHKYKSCVGYWVHYQKIALEEDWNQKGLNGHSSAHMRSHLCVQCVVLSLASDVLNEKCIPAASSSSALNSNQRDLSGFYSICLL